ncbi:MAG: hypothetical protein JXR03_11090 [Cyclobacteriaceae bacterium]
MKTKNILVMLVALALTTWSCGDSYDDFEPEVTSARAVSGQWIVDYSAGGAVVASHARIDIYNTAADDGTAWVDEHDHLISGFKVKVNTSGTDFSVDGAADALAADPDNPDMISILDGKIIDGDSINFTISIVYGDGSPTETYGIAGNLYTGFE